MTASCLKYTESYDRYGAMNHLKVFIHVFYSVRRWKRWWFNIETIIPNLQGVPLSKQNMVKKITNNILKAHCQCTKLKADICIVMRIFIYQRHNLIKTIAFFSSWRRGKICVCTPWADERKLKILHCACALFNSKLPYWIKKWIQVSQKPVPRPRQK